MQTLRKLPTHRPRSTAPTTSTGSTPTQHLIEKNAGRDRDVERLGTMRERNCNALRGDGVELRTNPGAFVADDHRDELLLRRARLQRPRDRRAVGRGGPQDETVLARPRDEGRVVELQYGMAE